MSGFSDRRQEDFLDLTSDVIASYVSKNSVRPADLSDLIRNVSDALSSLAQGTSKNPEAEIEKPTVAQIRKSVTPDGIISFVDGKSYKILKRHLGTHGLSPNAYRTSFGLPADYPMVAPNYAARRSELAKSIGLGRTADRGEDEQSPAGGRKKAA